MDVFSKGAVAAITSVLVINGIARADGGIKFDDYGYSDLTFIDGTDHWSVAGIQGTNSAMIDSTSPAPSGQSMRVNNMAQATRTQQAADTGAWAVYQFSLNMDTPGGMVEMGVASESNFNVGNTMFFGTNNGEAYVWADGASATIAGGEILMNTWYDIKIRHDAAAWETELFYKESANNNWILVGTQTDWPSQWPGATLTQISPQQMRFDVQNTQAWVDNIGWREAWVIPEPGTMTLLGLGALLLRRRKRSRNTKRSHTKF